MEKTLEFYYTIFMLCDCHNKGSITETTEHTEAKCNIIYINWHRLKKDYLILHKYCYWVTSIAEPE